jgi:hypothetical protein
MDNITTDIGSAAHLTIQNITTGILRNILAVSNGSHQNLWGHHR